MTDNGDSRLQYGFNGETILLRSRRGEIDPYMVKLTGVKEVQAAWRERCHANLWDNLTPQQQNAWEGIQKGFDAITAIMHANAMDYSAARGQGVGSDDHGAAIQADYRAWADRVRHRRMKLDMIVDILCVGHSIRQASAKAKTSQHLARLAMVAALDVYSELRGWR